MKNYRHSRLVNLALFCSAVFIFFFLLELYFRLFSPQILQHDELFREDPQLGWVFLPDRKAGIIFANEVRQYVQTNKQGFRDTDFDLNGKKKKIMFLGDSFVSNISVKQHEVFTEVMEQHLKDTDVLNMGVNGYGQVQEFLLLEKTIGRYRPDVIMVMIYTRNDFSDNIGRFSWSPADAPYAVWDEKTSNLRFVKQDSGHRFHRTAARSAGRLHIFHFFRERIQTLVYEHLVRSGKEMPPFTLPELRACRKTPTPLRKYKLKVMQELLLKISRLAERSNVPVVFVAAPSLLRIKEEVFLAELRKNRLDPSHYDVMMPEKRLKAIGEKLGLRMIELYPYLRKEYLRGKKIYFESEKHWTAEGNRVVAEKLVEYLKSERLI